MIEPGQETGPPPEPKSLSMRELARWALLTITAGWTFYLLSRFLIGIAANFGLDGGMGNDSAMSDLSNLGPLLLHGVDGLALTGYGLAAWFIHRRRWLALPAYGVAFLLDMSVWIVASASYAGYELTSLMHTSLVNWVINIILLCTLVGLMFLQQARVLR